MATRKQNELWESLSREKRIDVIAQYHNAVIEKKQLHKTFETLYGKSNLEKEKI